MLPRTIDKHELTTSKIGFGATGVDLAYGLSDEQQGVETIRSDLDLGVPTSASPSPPARRTTR